MSGKNKRNALGRGLDALLGDSGFGIEPADMPAGGTVLPQKDDRQNLRHAYAEAEQSVIGAIAAIDIALIDVNPQQPRTQFDEQALQELSDSIREHGIIQPLTVRKHGKRYQLISGERRLRASKQAGLTEVPVYIRMANENEMLEMGLVENIQREELNAMDIALSYQALADAYRYSQEEVSKRVGKDRSTVTNYMRLLKLPAEVQLALKNNDISMGHARALLAEENPEQQVGWVRRIMEKGLSVRAVEEGIRQGKAGRKTVSAAVPALPDWCVEDSRRLSEKLDTAVEVRKQKGGKGSLQIRFSSEKELQKILNLLNA
ncbi:MAG: ParB/RepB/Spo0J family partition protein [Bacteroidales bacterium]|nr:ParB/RepB/Spo0J family partition protein [Bacteroidales bacterium]